MKISRLIAILLTVALLASVTVSVSAFWGSGVSVVRSEVSMIKTGLVGKNLTFKDTDFKCALGVDDFEYITVTELPSSNDGVLMIAGRRVREGQRIERRKIATVMFIPKDKSVESGEMTFSVDGEGDTPIVVR